MSMPHIHFTSDMLKSSIFFVIFYIGCFFIYSLALILNLNKIINGYGVTYLIQLYMFITIFMALFPFQFNKSSIGWNLNNLKYNLKSGFTLGILLSILCIVYRYWYYNLGNTEYGFHVTNFDIFEGIVIYPIVIVLQETVAKGLFFNYLFELLKDKKYRTFLAAFFTALVFAQFHLFYGYVVFLLTLLYTIVTCYYFLNSRSVVGLLIIHYLTGMSLFFGANLF